ncbi:GATA type zinc finger protein asd-4 [Tolypocladium capitatum]|uniref:GATA type zinc finger protein asd-4 n=1 Tax=Tolypocladium capitatum TaxID=45235 RepID=A0A2K3QJE7_9HYPO|nr:GATA type zinc finger protein asd-4 [Tolypocladium capitatum]
MMEDSLQMLPPHSVDPISRPSSTSTSASATLPQLPGIAVLATSNAAPEPPQPRATAALQALMNAGVSHAATSGGGGNMVSPTEPNPSATMRHLPSQSLAPHRDVRRQLSPCNHRNQLREALWPGRGRCCTASRVLCQASGDPYREGPARQRFFCSVILIDHDNIYRVTPCLSKRPSIESTGNMMATNTSSQPTCQNCTTSTTPLWRRDEFGSVLCNACGLFLKLHGRPRPISLKTDVIKSRNRVKAMRPDLAPKKKKAAAAAAAQAIRTAQRSANGNNEGSDSPISRTGTPSMYNQGIPSFMVDDPYQTSFNGGAGVDGSTGSPMNGDRGLDSPQTHEQIMAHNSSLKTRVSELEVINELFRGRLSQLEQQEAAARRGQEVAGVEQTQLRSQLEAAQESEAQLRNQLEDSHRRENNLKRRLDELELEIKEAKEAVESDRPSKKPRMDQDEDSAATPTQPDLTPPSTT